LLLFRLCITLRCTMIDTYIIRIQVDKDFHSDPLLILHYHKIIQPVN
jgi:hypothetical protein